MLATIPSATLLGVEGHPVAVEVHVSNGLPGFTIVGLPDAACRESRDRVRAALLSSGLAWPMRRVTVNLAPSGMRKGGAGLDLPIADTTVRNVYSVFRNAMNKGFGSEWSRRIPARTSTCRARHEKRWRSSRRTKSIYLPSGSTPTTAS